jgi:hypothetical protein
MQPLEAFAITQNKASKQKRATLTRNPLMLIKEKLVGGARFELATNGLKDRSIAV